MRPLFAIPVLLCLPLMALAASEADQQASALFDTDWQWRMRNQPEYATTVGDYRYNHLLSDTSLAGLRAATSQHALMLEQARQLDRSTLSAATALSLDLFIFEKEQLLQMAALYPYPPQPLTGQHGVHISFAQTVAQMPFATEMDYLNYISRLDRLPLHLAGITEQLREGMRSGWVAPRAAMRRVPAMLRQLRENAVTGPLGQPFRQIPATIDKTMRDAIAEVGPATLRNKVVPALQELEDFVRTQYLPLARESIAASALPGGAQYYALLVAQHTGSTLSPAQVHALGQKEVARIHARMPAAIARTGFKGSFAQFAAFATSDKRLFYDDPAAMLRRYRSLLARTTAALPRLFESVPAQELLVKPASDAGAAYMAGAWYEAGTADRPAAFVVNTTRLQIRPRWEMETLALHEGVPGHHLQAARARELAGLPAFRRHAWHGAFGEGWAMYAETLGPELGLFRDAFSAFGHLNAELFRAVRLVVDTGIHSQGWTRQQAIDYMNANTANSRADNELEVDRYIAWPAQALGYKIGQLKFRQLREKSQAALGANFDVRRFHSVLLDNGPLPLYLLEQQVDQWLAAAPAKASAPARN
ncbi:DUF885 domain-containing protein [Massilia sp. PAMC28688]|uniref:DUF885 domain-containing protein n=1 Tax=Massilia sp. PAMC28688 TaxID=2861283 RepID=UPI001C62D5E3|nr:DUF885 domain-containing protein [Massilia sp. PAMC28688]QYF95109.1 DUF885 domain-containing protein [Massilia sp. PAMC28688]